mmetsp:Transcript_30957/g.66513  ORF Transcript_30957/g.66513 Transcript_30957/m.66513 type:complete len:328 (-) Transcript_30957:371-1354(-)
MVWMMWNIMQGTRATPEMLGAISCIFWITITAEGKVLRLHTITRVRLISSDMTGPFFPSSPPPAPALARRLPTAAVAAELKRMKSSGKARPRTATCRSSPGASTSPRLTEKLSSASGTEMSSAAETSDRALRRRSTHRATAGMAARAVMPTSMGTRMDLTRDRKSTKASMLSRCTSPPAPPAPAPAPPPTTAATKKGMVAMERRLEPTVSMRASAGLPPNWVAIWTPVERAVGIQRKTVMPSTRSLERKGHRRARAALGAGSTSAMVARPRRSGTGDCSARLTSPSLSTRPEMRKIPGADSLCSLSACTLHPSRGSATERQIAATRP